MKGERFMGGLSMDTIDSVTHNTFRLCCSRWDYVSHRLIRAKMQALGPKNINSYHVGTRTVSFKSFQIIRQEKFESKGVL